MNEREKLIEELRNQKWAILNISHIADFILADRKRIVEPLVKLKEQEAKITQWNLYMMKAIKETLKNAGIE